VHRLSALFFFSFTFHPVCVLMHKQQLLHTRIRLASIVQEPSHTVCCARHVP
jgi:hypothetical protein